MTPSKQEGTGPDSMQHSKDYLEWIMGMFCFQKDFVRAVGRDITSLNPNTNCRQNQRWRHSTESPGNA